jgi:hypothetical protein
LPLKLVVVRTTSWREGVLLGRPDRSRIYARIDALPGTIITGLESSDNWRNMYLADQQ